MAISQHNGHARSRVPEFATPTSNDGHLGVTRRQSVAAVEDPASMALSNVNAELIGAIASGEAVKFSSLRFRVAVEQLLAAIAPTVRGRTPEVNRQYGRALSKFFGDLRLRDIHIGHVRAYQQARLTNLDERWKRAANPGVINQELALLQRVLKNAGCWAGMADLYKPLKKVDSGRRKVMTDVEERNFRATAASRPEWRLAYNVAMLTLSTTRAGTELRNLRLQDVVLEGAEPRIIIDGSIAKNGYRGGAVRLTEAGRQAAEECVARAKRVGSFRPEHYVFPWRKGKGSWDPSRPASGAWLRRAWEELRHAAGVPWLTPHCLRHQAITKLAEAKASDESIRQIAGHVSVAMLRVYSHCRLEHQAVTLQALEMAPAQRQSRPTQLQVTAQVKRPGPVVVKGVRRALLSRRRRVV